MEDVASIFIDIFNPYTQTAHINIYVNNVLKESVQANDHTLQERIWVDALVPHKIGDQITISAVDERKKQNLLLNNKELVNFTNGENFYVSAILSEEGL